MMGILIFFSVWIAWASPCPKQFAEIGNPKSQVQLTNKRNPLLPLEELIKNTGLTRDQVDLMRKNSMGVIDAEDFLKIRKALGSGYLLNKDGIRQTETIFSSPMGLRHWYDGYDSVGMRMRWKHPDPAAHTPEYMEKITATGEPIVFLVPAGIMDGTSGFTRAEMRWLLEQPERMKNVYFVFGAYELVPDEVLKSFSADRDWKLIEEVLRP